MQPNEPIRFDWLGNAPTRELSIASSWAPSASHKAAMEKFSLP